MALTYKTDQITLNAANTDFTILTASASTTLVKNICWIHDDHNTNVILSLTKSGGTKTQIGTFSATADTPLKIWPDILPLEANDILHLQSDHISSSDVGYCIISYVEDTASVAGQSIDVHTDVSISGITNGQVLQWNNSTTQFEPATGGTDLSSADTDDLAEGSTNLYFTDARVAANSAVTTNTAKTTFPGFGTTAGTALEGDTALLQLGTTSSTALAGDTTTISTAQANAITANTAKVSADGLVTTHSDVSSAGSGSIITTAERTKLTGIAAGAEVNVIDAVVDDVTPQLGGDLDVQASKITTSTTNGSVILEPDGTGLVQVNGDTNAGAIKLMCEAGTHGVSIASPPHSAAATYDLVLPNSAGSANQVLQTDGSGNLSWTAQTGGSDTNLANTNLTADNNRTYDQDGNDLTFDPNGGEFAINDSSGLPTLAELTIGQGQTNIRGVSVDINGITYPSVDGTNGQVITTDGSGNLSFQTVSGGGSSSLNYARLRMGSDVLKGGASQQNFNTSVAKVKFNTQDDLEGTGITVDTTNNRLTVGASGYYRITANSYYDATGSSQRKAPMLSIRVNGVEVAGKSMAYVRCTQTFGGTANVTRVIELTANDYVEIWSEDLSSDGNVYYAEEAIFEVESVGGIAGADGAQGPSGTSYDVTTLTGSTTLSSSHTTKYLVCNSASAMNLTVPASAAYDTYAEFVIEQRGAGQVTVVADTGVTIHSTETLKSGAQYAVLGLKRTDTNTYVLTGEREAAP